jgi:hypothetical protein
MWCNGVGRRITRSRYTLSETWLRFRSQSDSCTMNESLDARQYAPATQRNREAILEVLLQVLPPTGTVLEVSSGTGEHAVFFAPRLIRNKWIPSDPNPLARASIAAWRERCPADNLYPQSRWMLATHSGVLKGMNCQNHCRI